MDLNHWTSCCNIPPRADGVTADMVSNGSEELVGMSFLRRKISSETLGNDVRSLSSLGDVVSMILAFPSEYDAPHDMALWPCSKSSLGSRTIETSSGA